MRRHKLSEAQRYLILIFDALWRAHTTALTIAQIRARGYDVNNATLSSLHKLGLVRYTDGRGWSVTAAGRAYAELLHENLLLKSDPLAEKVMQKLHATGEESNA